jgi:acetyl esterase
MMTPETREVLAKQEELAGDAFATDVGFEEMRANYIKERAFWNEGGPEMAKTINLELDGPLGPLPVRFHYPQNLPDGPAPALVFIHGGGYVVGNLDTHDRIMRMIADEAQVVVMGVDYRLSPESKFPGNVQEGAFAAHYLHEHAAEFGVDAQRLAFGGDSGGATLSFASNLWLRDEYQDNGYIKCLLLWYGMFGLLDSRSQRLLGGTWDGLTEADLAYYRDMYCKDPATDAKSPYVNCLGADLSQGIPPCFIVAAGLDPLRDDSATLQAMLEVEGVPAEYKVYDGIIHGFLHHSRMLPEAREAIAGGARFLRDHI